MDGVSFAFGVVQIADLCLKYGKKLIETYQAYKHSEQRIVELVIRTEGVWVKVQNQVVLLQKIAQSLPDQLLAFFDASLHELFKKLSAACAEVNDAFGVGEDAHRHVIRSSSIKLPFWKRLRYSMLEKSLRATVVTLENWHGTFDPSWYLITLIADGVIDRTLAESSGAGDNSTALSSLQNIRNVIHSSSASSVLPFQDQQWLSSDRTPMLGTSATLSYMKSTSQPVVVDTTAFPPGSDLPTVSSQVADLARVLSASDPDTLGLLHCVGAIQNTRNAVAEPQFDLVFELPNGLHRPRSLRDRLNSEEPSLDVRFSIGKTLAKSVLAVHSAKFVHKNIRPETILVIETVENQLPVPFLLGFEQFRHITHGSRGIGDMVWQRNLYRHPKRQGQLPEDVYSMYHDIYSLGVCLLEVGLWSSFVSMDTQPAPNAVLELDHQLFSYNPRKAAVGIKQRFVSMAENMLPRRMGNTYTSVVLVCLTVLDPNAETNMFKDDSIEDTDEVAVGLQFIEKVLLRLEELSV